MSASVDAGKTVVLYDGDCSLCSHLMKAAIRLDRRGKLEPIRLQTPGALEHYGIARADAKNALHVVAPGGGTARSGNALRLIVAQLDWFWPAAYLWRVPGFAWLADRLYFLVADNRTRFGALLRLSETCEVPHPTSRRQG